MKRRKFIKNSVAITSGSLIAGSLIKSAWATEVPEAIKISGGEPAAMLRTALAEYGGMKHFISRGDVVVVKPNIGWDRAPEFAANTNPDLVAEVVRLAVNAGAKTVKVFDRTCNNPLRCYVNSQIEAKCKKLGADVIHVRERKFKNLTLPNAEILKEWPVYQDYLEADKVINMPIAKHHSLSYVTLGLKNLMGVMGGNRGSLHNQFAKKLIDIDSEILPDLTIIDGYRILTNNGPVGGNLADVALKKTLIMSKCVVSADYLALDLFGLQKEQIGYLTEAYRRGIHLYQPDKLKLKEIRMPS